MDKEKKGIKQFNFGKNWNEFTKKSLTEKKIKIAEKDFEELFCNVINKNKTFLDIGFGQGLSLCIATRLKFKTFGNDINPICNEVLNKTRLYFKDLNNVKIPVIIGSILEKGILNKIKKINNNKLFDIVHSWGVLHHTGDMWKAIEYALKLVNDNGYLMIAIYNKHWTCKLWFIIKKLYNKGPKIVKKLLILFFYILKIPYLFFSKGRIINRERGMSYYFDLVDWLGGYPYEYASKREIEDFISNYGFKLIKYIPTTGFTGCNQFLFKKL